MRFGIVDLYCGPSGGKGFYNNQEIGLARAMRNKGYDCYIFYPDLRGKQLKEELIEEKIILIKCPAKSIGVHCFYDWRVLLKYGIEVVQVGADNQIFVPNLIKFCDKNGIPSYNYIGTIKSDTDKTLKKMISHFLFYRNLAIYKKHKNFAKTENVKNDLKAMGVENVEIAPVGLDTAIIPEITDSINEIRLNNNIPIDKTILLFVGRIEKYKKPEDMLKVLNKLSEDYYGIIIGEGFRNNELEVLIEKMHLENKIKWIKKIANTEIHKYYHAADYYLNFNTHEIFGMSILEAMYQGCNVIAVKAPGPIMIIEDRKSGFLVDNIEEMGKILSSKRKLNDSEIRERIIDNFTWEKSASIFHNWICTVIR